MNASFVRAILSVAFVVSFAACGGSQPPIEAPGAMPQAFAIATQADRGTSWMLPEAKTKNLIYVADGGEVWIFPEKRNAPPIEAITDGITSANGAYVDRQGDLYVANYVFESSTVTVYAPDSLMLSSTYSEDLNRPLYPIVDSKGNLFVSNAGDGTVVEYLSGSTSAYKVLHTDGTEADGVDFDRKGNLYVAYRSNSTDSIEEFAPGSTQGKSLGMQLDQPQGLVVTDDGKILVVETGGTNRIDEFLPGSKTPKIEVSVPQTPVQLAITEVEDRIFVSTLGGAVYVTPYPLDHPHLVQEADGGYQTQGIALSNGQHF